MALLVKVLLAMFALQLSPPVLCKDQPKFNFGDLISIAFPSAGKNLPVYIHWAVYVGKGNVEGLKDIKSDEEDIFYAYGGELSKDPVCIFNTLSKISGQPEVFNYLDKDKDGKGHTPVNKEDMIKQIKELHTNCVWWDPILNDCEHVLAYIRYGTKNLPKCK